MSNLGLEHFMRAKGGRLERTQVGDRYVVERMRIKGYNFGGEQSGHLIFLDHNTTGDGILAALRLLAVMIRENKRLSELAGEMTAIPQVLRNVRISRQLPVARISGLKQLAAGLEAELGREGRILIRASGTEPLIRVMVEGPDQQWIETIAAELCEHIQRQRWRRDERTPGQITGGPGPGPKSAASPGPDRRRPGAGRRSNGGQGRHPAGSGNGIERQGKPLPLREPGRTETGGRPGSFRR
jgi:hypothetical protein